MRLSWSIVLLLLVAQTAGAVQWPLEIFEIMDDRKIVVFLEEADITTSPTWDPAEGGPPLTLAEVVQKLSDWVGASDRLADLKIHEIKLKPIRHHESEQRWYYLVQLRRQIDGQPDRHYVAVLMNGKVVPALREPSSLK